MTVFEVCHGSEMKMSRVVQSNVLLSPWVWLEVSMSDAFLSVIKLSRRVDVLLTCPLQGANLPFFSNTFSTFKRL